MDEIYRRSLCEVSDILDNTEQSLIDMLPDSFITWIKENKLENYKTTIQADIPIEKQKLFQETEAIIALIYRKYWANDEERKFFSLKDKKEFITIEEQKRSLYNAHIFNNRYTANPETTENTDLIPIKNKNNFFKQVIYKIKNFFFHNHK